MGHAGERAARRTIGPVVTSPGRSAAASVADGAGRTGGFGPTALATPANAVTVARLAATPVVIVLVALNGPSWTAFAIAVGVGLTDGLDGWLARRQGPTRSGAFIDPLADKAAVIGVLAVVAARGEVSWVPVAVIAARELAMSGYRSWVGRRGVSVPARLSAKVKTLVQGLATLACLAPPAAPHRLALDVALWVAVVPTMLSGAQYWRDGRQSARPSGGEPAAPSPS